MPSYAYHCVSGAFWDQLLRVSSKCPVLIEGYAVLLFYAPRQNKWGASNLKKSEQANESQNDSNTKCILDKKDIDAGKGDTCRGHTCLVAIKKAATAETGQVILLQSRLRKTIIHPLQQNLWSSFKSWLKKKVGPCEPTEPTGCLH